LENYIVEFVDESKNVVVYHEWYGYKKIIMSWINRMLSFYETKTQKILFPRIKKQ